MNEIPICEWRSYRESKASGSSTCRWWTRTPTTIPRKNMIANFEETAECKGNWIGASVAQDGKFTVTNGRNGFSKSYVAR
jgi:hypothetical protein